MKRLEKSCTFKEKKDYTLGVKHPQIGGLKKITSGLKTVWMYDRDLEGINFYLKYLSILKPEYTLTIEYQNKGETIFIGLIEKRKEAL